jgi:cytidylate kinase
MKGGVVAIDGPAASGKSTTARAVAEALDCAQLDSGSLYRGVTLVGMREASRRERAGEDPLTVVGPEAILRAAEDRGLMLQPDGAGFAAYLEGEPVDAVIRGADVTARVSAISAVPVIREWINSRLRAMVRAGRDVVVDGRDIGTVVFPDAELKIFLTATPEARAGRRISQRGNPPNLGGREAEPAALSARDRADSSRAVAPLKAAPDAVPLDTTTMAFPEQVRFIVELARPIFGTR